MKLLNEQKGFLNIKVYYIYPSLVFNDDDNTFTP